MPANYKQIIENILCAENRWKEMFSCLIDIEEYFDNHFANLLTDYIYTREYQEEHHDYSADSVRKMHDLWESKINEGIGINVPTKQKSKVIVSVKKGKRKLI